MFSKLKALGPGLLYAGAAIGVSHIVQSTKAGAQYGWILIIGIVLAHIFKYPFFELGPKYTAIKGENILHGYAKLGKWALVIVFLLTVSTMFFIQAAVTVVTAGLAMKITGLVMEPWQMSLILLLICIAILGIGKFKVLDNLMKVIMVVLAVTTIVAFSASFFATPIVNQADMSIFDMRSSRDIIFLIAFLGWMPAPLDISIWHSIWSEENNRVKGIVATLKQTLFDFKIGFWGTACLAFCFLMLGSNIIYGTGTALSSSGIIYAGQLINIFVSSIGDWAYYVISIAAFTTMFSTTLTCLDAMPRVVTETLVVWNKNEAEPFSLTIRKKIKFGTMLLLTGVAVFILARYVSNMKEMVNLATSISFLTAPVLALLGIIVVRKHLPKGFWSKQKTILAWVGVLFLILLSLYYIKLSM
jgi:Mn2+/Fe2+ NRAMP family transporter